MRNALVTFASFLFCGTCVLGSAGDKIALSDLPQHAIKESQITASGAPPFHLKARVFEKTDRNNDNHNAEIEEFWVAPNKWRRTIKAEGFAETLVTNGEKVTEHLDGDYYPNWLRTIVNAIFDPGAVLQGVDLTKSGDTAMGRITPLGTLEPAAVSGPHVCRRFAVLAGSPPVTNQVFSTFCFNDGLIESIGAPGYDASYSSYKRFVDKRVARTIDEYIEPGTELEARVEDLQELTSPDETLFATPSSNAPVRTLRVSESTFRSLIVGTPEIQWPPMARGRNPGMLSIYVCVDRRGHVRETYSLNSDSPDMAQAAREQVMKWSFTPAANNGEIVQIESILTFGYHAPAFPKK
jgi:hypothetical protein